MTASVPTRHFLKDTDLSPAEQAEVLDLAVRMKAAPYSVQPFAADGSGRKTVAVIFDKTSTRTRVSFATGIADMGGNALIINPGEAQIGHKESVEDTAKVLERMVSTIVWRTGAHAGLVAMAENSRVPVINALCDDYHPCQLLADLLTVKEHKGDAQGPDHGATWATPPTTWPTPTCWPASRRACTSASPARKATCRTPEIIAAAEDRAAETGGSVLVTIDAAEALRGADVVATDTWVSMGQEAEKEARMKLFRDYSVDADAMKLAAPDAVVLHCLPGLPGLRDRRGRH